MFTAHEKTFLYVRRNLENANDKTIGELEMKMLHPMKHQKYLIETKSENNGTSCRHHYSRDIARMNPELPSFVSDKYKWGLRIITIIVRVGKRENFHTRDWTLVIFNVFSLVKTNFIFINNHSSLESHYQIFNPSHGILSGHFGIVSAIRIKF